MALAADMRWAAAGRGKLGVPEVALGVLPGTGGTARLARALGRTKAIELMVNGTNMSFEDAAELGLVNEILPAEGFLDTVLEKARGYCPPAKASRAVGLIKRSVVSGLDMGLPEHLAFERELQQRLFTGEDAAEGLAAFTEKRAPRFTGR